MFDKEKYYDEILTIYDANVYLDKIKTNLSSLIVIVSSKDALINNEFWNQLSVILSLKMLEIKKDEMCYAAIINSGENIFELINESLIDYSSTISGFDLHVQSKKNNEDFYSSIFVNGLNVSCDKKGLNIVLVDKNRNEILDSVCLSEVNNIIYVHRKRLPHGPDKKMYAEWNSDRLFVKDAEKWMELANHSYIMQAHPNVQIVPNGIALPIKCSPGPIWSGGICDENNKFIAGIETFKESSLKKSYSVDLKTVKYLDEDVIFGGVLLVHFGHMITDSMSRLWWYVKNKQSNLKILFLIEWGGVPNWLFDWLELLGLTKDKLYILQSTDRPLQFKKIIIPDEARCINHYMPEWILPMNLMAENALKLVDKTSLPNKIYYTRSKYAQGSGTKIIDEEYIENYYKSKGYTIISPEKYSIAEQVAMAANAEAIAANLGTLSHMMIFSRKGIKCDIWLRDSWTSSFQVAAFQFKNADWAIVDLAMSFLPFNHNKGVLLCGVTDFWRKYVTARWLQAWDPSLEMSDYTVVKYLKEWAQFFIEYPEYYSKLAIDDSEIFNIFARLSYYLVGKIPEYRLYNVGESKSSLRKKLAALTNEVLILKKNIQEKENDLKQKTVELDTVRTSLNEYISKQGKFGADINVIDNEQNTKNDVADNNVDNKTNQVERDFEVIKNDYAILINNYEELFKNYSSLDEKYKSLLGEDSCVYRSISYRIGRFITFIPRKIRDCFRKNNEQKVNK